jgi:hypothetical protein
LIEITNIGKIQIGDRYHACVSSENLRPPKCTECEKRLVHQFDKLLASTIIGNNYLVIVPQQYLLSYCILISNIFCKK